MYTMYVRIGYDLLLDTFCVAGLCCMDVQFSLLLLSPSPQNELILAAKVNILQNDEKIQQILQNMSFSVTT